VAKLHRSLVKHGFSAIALHGDMDQRSRTNALESFRKGEIMLLIASDVAARGLDIPDVSHVFNFDVPHHAEDYVHRIGRTGRAGRSGAAFTIAAPMDSKSLAAIEKLIGRKIAWQERTVIPDSEQVEQPENSGEQPRSERGRNPDHDVLANMGKRPQRQITEYAAPQASNNERHRTQAETGTMPEANSEAVRATFRRSCCVLCL
jgi:superfamily II DNA/RNA helicase